MAAGRLYLLMAALPPLTPTLHRAAGDIGGHRRHAVRPLPWELWWLYWSAVLAARTGATGVSVRLPQVPSQVFLTAKIKSRGCEWATQVNRVKRLDQRPGMIPEAIYCTAHRAKRRTRKRCGAIGFGLHDATERKDRVASGKPVFYLTVLRPKQRPNHLRVDIREFHRVQQIRTALAVRGQFGTSGPWPRKRAAHSRSDGSRFSIRAIGWAC